MRTLSDDELQEAVLKYGDPDDYYNKHRKFDGIYRFKFLKYNGKNF